MFFYDCGVVAPCGAGLSVVRAGGQRFFKGGFYERFHYVEAETRTFQYVGAVSPQIVGEIACKYRRHMKECTLFARCRVYM